MSGTGKERYMESDRNSDRSRQFPQGSGNWFWGDHVTCQEGAGRGAGIKKRRAREEGTCPSGYRRSRKDGKEG